MSLQAGSIGRTGTISNSASVAGNLPTILCHARPVTTPFGLLGNDENALSFALGYTFAKCPRLLQCFLLQIGVGGLRRESLNGVEISLQRHERGGITDIEISLPGKLFVIVEAKVGLSLPTLEQCLKYVPRFEGHEAAKKRLVALVASPAGSLLDTYGEKQANLRPLLTIFHWMDLIPECANLLTVYASTTEPGQWIRAFQQFLEQEYTMRSFTEEVWIVSTNRKPLWAGGMSFYDTHFNGRIYYRPSDRPTHHGKRPLYIAFRVDGKVTHIQKVLSVQHETSPVAFVPQLKKVAETWPTNPHTVWHLDEPTALPNPIPTGDSTMQARMFSCDFDILISSESIREAVQRMKSRRGTSDDPLDLF
jgi:hypothetical protein